PELIYAFFKIPPHLALVCFNDRAMKITIEVGRHHITPFLYDLAAHKCEPRRHTRRASCAALLAGYPLRIKAFLLYPCEKCLYLTVPIVEIMNAFGCVELNVEPQTLQKLKAFS